MPNKSCIIIYILVSLHYLEEPIFTTPSIYTFDMPAFRKKAEENMSAACLLIKNSMFTSSVHCSYYAGFQFSKYVLANCCGIDYITQENNSSGKDSHYYVTHCIEEDMLKKTWRIAMADYNKYYSKLKRLRKKADYLQDIITSKEATDAYDWADKMTTLLKNKYSLL